MPEYGMAVLVMAAPPIRDNSVTVNGRAREWVRDVFNPAPLNDISVFETTIRCCPCPKAHVAISDTICGIARRFFAHVAAVAVCMTHEQPPVERAWCRAHNAP